MRDPGPTYARASAAGDLTAVKIMQDGVAENGTAALVEPYLDRCGHPTGNTGISFVAPDELRRHVRALDAKGFQVHFHGLGDRGVREALDALEGTEPARRHHIAHLQLVHPDDVARFARLGVAAHIQALWACRDEQMTELTIPFLGAERAARSHPHRRAPDVVRRARARRHGSLHAGTGAGDRGGFRRLHERLRVGEPPRRRRHPDHRCRPGALHLDRRECVYDG